jgi:hypothetical protein
MYERWFEIPPETHYWDTFIEDVLPFVQELEEHHSFWHFLIHETPKKPYTPQIHVRFCNAPLAKKYDCKAYKVSMITGYITHKSGNELKGLWYSLGLLSQSVKEYILSFQIQKRLPMTTEIMQFTHLLNNMLGCTDEIQQKTTVSREIWNIKSKTLGYRIA